MTKTTKRGRGRPRLMPKSPEQLREEARAGIQRSFERRGVIHFAEAEEAVEAMLDSKRLQDWHRSEIKELRRIAERLWDQLEIEKQFAEEEQWQHTGEYVEGPPPGCIDKAQWEKEHEFLKPKRKNAKKIHSITSLPEHKRERYGLATEPTKPEFDIESTEAELLDALVKRHNEEKRNERTPPKGRRVQERPTARRPAVKPKSFWI